MPDAISPAEELKQLKATLANLQKELDAVKKRIADVEKTAGDIEQKNKDAEKAAAAAEKQVEELKEYVDFKKKVLEPKVPAAEIAAKKKEAEDALKAAKKAADDATQAVRTKETELAKADATVAEKKKAFTDLGARLAANADALKGLAALRAAAEKEGAANKLSRMYFLILIMLDRLNALKLTPPKEYAAELNAAGAALGEAVKTQRGADDALKTAKDQEKVALKNFQDEKAKWVQETLDALPEDEEPEDEPEPEQPQEAQPASDTANPEEQPSTPS